MCFFTTSIIPPFIDNHQHPLTSLSIYECMYVLVLPLCLHIYIYIYIYITYKWAHLVDLYLMLCSFIFSV